MNYPEVDAGFTITHEQYLKYREMERAHEAQKADMQPPPSRHSMQPEKISRLANRRPAEDLSWQNDANCIGQAEIFSPGNPDEERLKEKVGRLVIAQLACGVCPVNSKCEDLGERQVYDDKSIWNAKTNSARKVELGRYPSQRLK